MTVLFFR